MRLLAMLLSLGAIGWLLYTAAGGDEAETVIPEAYQQQLDEAREMENAIQDEVRKQMEAVDGN